MARKKKKNLKVPDKIDPNKIKSRNYLLLELINGTTKSSVHKDRKKEQNKQACRKPNKGNE